LLGIRNDDEKPFAELWMGAHPDLPSKVYLDGKTRPLNELVTPKELPFLLKVLSAAKPLSIQVHPSKERAREGFARENRAGIPLTAKERNYKDENHKPELICALTEFYGLRGFRPLEEIARSLREVPELSSFESTSGALKPLYEKLMTLPQGDVDAMLTPLVRRLEDDDKKTPFTHGDREYWILQADREFSREGHRDRGLFSFYLLNLVHLCPGEAMFLPAGVLHAYLVGSGMEIMASSNNVLRGGLTPKHVDVHELLRNVSFESGAPEILRGVSKSDPRETVYSTPAEEFELSRIELDADRPYSVGSNHPVEIVALIDSEAERDIELTSGTEILAMGKGRACLIPHELPYTMSASGRATLYKAAVCDRDASVKDSLRK
jgi:mannose-6-phosphate isomerase class I